MTLIPGLTMREARLWACRTLSAAILAATCLAGQSPAATLSMMEEVLPLDPYALGPVARELLTAYLQGDRADAVARLEVLREINPNATDLMLVEGHIRLHEDPNAALDLAASALTMSGRNPAALDLMSAAFARYRAAAPSDAIDAEIRAVEIASYERLLTQHPDWAELLFRTASQRIALERLQPAAYDQLGLAEAELRRAIAAMPAETPPATRAQAHFQLGRALKHREDSRPTDAETTDLPPLYAEAIAEFDQTVALDPNRLDALGEIALVYLARGRPNDALDRMQAAEAAFQDPALRAKLDEMRGDLLRQLGRTEEAIAALEAAISADETRDGASLTLVQLLYQEGRATDGFALLERTAAARPDLLEAHRMLAQATATSNPDRAMAAYRALLAVPAEEAATLGMLPSPERYRTGLYYEAALGLAELYLAADNRSDAIAALETAQAIGGETPQSRDLAERLSQATPQ